MSPLPSNMYVCRHFLDIWICINIPSSTLFPEWMPFGKILNFVHSGLGHQKSSGKPIQKHQTWNTWVIFAELINVKGTDFCMSLLFWHKIRQIGLPFSCRSYPKIQQTKILVTCQRFGDLFLFGLVWQYSSVQTKCNKAMATYLQQ